MNLRTKTTVFGLLFSVISFAQLPANCSGSSPRVTIAGDSWAQYMADDNSHNLMLNWYGHADKGAISQTHELCIGCSSTPGPNDYAVSGSEARQWADEASYDYVQNLVDELNANPTIDWVVLSIGGNDILAARSGGGWYKDMDLDVPGSEAALFATILADTEYIMNEIWTRARPDINFMISSYDFPNFNVSSLWCGFYACGKREDLSRDSNGNGTIDADELITDVEISAMMETVEGIRKGAADANSKIFYDNGMGLTHYFYGYDDGLYPDILPGTTPYPQGSTPYNSGGDPNTPTDRDNFRLVGVFGLPGLISADPIHLDQETYEYKIKNQMDNILFEDLRRNNTDNFSTFWSIGAQDGYVDIIENTMEGNGIRLGDDGIFCCFGEADHDYRGILSFNTASLPDNAQITGASIYMMRSSENDNPFEFNDRNPVIDIKNGHFGNNANLEVADGTDAADAVDIGCFHGLVEEDKYALRVDVEASALMNVNLTGITQFRLYFDFSDWSAEYVNFYDGGGIPATLPPDVQAAQYKPKYAFRTIKEIPNPDGTFTEIEIEKGEEIEPREGYVLQEKLVEVREEDDGSIVKSFILFTPLEHPGLSKHMSDTYGAPGNGFAPFLDISFIVVLPVELLDFQALKQDKDAFLTWKTATEINSEGFLIEHSLDKKSWRNLGFISSNGNSEITQSYDFTHKTPTIGNHYYRLKMQDSDGSFQYSEIRHLRFDNENSVVHIFPNPFTESLSFEADFPKAGIVEIRVIDLLGKIVFQQNLEAEKGMATYQLNNLSFLAEGNYVVQILNEGNIFFGKVVKQ